MGTLGMEQLTGPAAIGIASAAANVIEKQAKEGGTGVQGQIMRQASLFGDIAIGGLAVLNHMQDFNLPILGKSNTDASKFSAGAGVALISRRAADWLGATMLQLPTGARYTAIGRGRPSRYRPSLRSPGAAVETSVLPRKRQFFSVT
jgi:hypothetical protein